MNVNSKFTSKWKSSVKSHEQTQHEKKIKEKEELNYKIQEKEEVIKKIKEKEIEIEKKRKADCEINETPAKRHSSLENIETRNDNIFRPWDMKMDEDGFDEIEK